MCIPKVEAHQKKYIKRRHPDLNWGIQVLQTRALPLGYAALNQTLSTITHLITIMQVIQQTFFYAHYRSNYGYSSMC